MEKDQKTPKRKTFSFEAKDNEIEHISEYIAWVRHLEGFRSISEILKEIVLGACFSELVIGTGDNEKWVTAEERIKLQAKADKAKAKAFQRGSSLATSKTSLPPEQAVQRRSLPQRATSEKGFPQRLPSVSGVKGYGHFKKSKSPDQSVYCPKTGSFIFIETCYEIAQEKHCYCDYYRMYVAPKFQAS